VRLLAPPQTFRRPAFAGGPGLHVAPLPV